MPRLPKAIRVRDRKGYGHRQASGDRQAQATEITESDAWHALAVVSYREPGLPISDATGQSNIDTPAAAMKRMLDAVGDDLVQDQTERDGSCDREFDFVRGHIDLDSFDLLAQGPAESVDIVRYSNDLSAVPQCQLIVRE